MSGIDFGYDDGMTLAEKYFKERADLEQKLEEAEAERGVFASQYEVEKKKIAVLTDAFDEKIKALTEENVRLEIKNELLLDQLKNKA